MAEAHYNGRYAWDGVIEVRHAILGTGLGIYEVGKGVIPHTRRGKCIEVQCGAVLAKVTSREGCNNGSERVARYNEGIGRIKGRGFLDP